MFCSYHPGLTRQPCDASSSFLPNGSQPEPCQPKPPDNWLPYSSHLEFELADFIYMCSQTSLVEAGGYPIFGSYKEMYQKIDNTRIGNIKWESFTVRYTGDAVADPAPWMNDEYDVWFRDPHKVVQNMLANPNFMKEMDFRPFHELLTGQNDYYPLYLSIGNICNSVCWAHCNGVILIAFLVMPKTTREYASKDNFHRFWQQLFHSSLGHILKTFKPSRAKPEVTVFGDDHYQHEQALLTCIVRNWCPQCLAYHSHLDDDNVLDRCHDHAELLVSEFSLDVLWDEYGIVGELVPFTNDFLHTDIYELIAPDLLHQIIKGTFKDHLVEWVEKYLCLTHRDSCANEILDDIDHWIAAVAPFPGLWHFPQGCHFKQWTGDDSKVLMKVYLPAIEGHVPKEIVCTFYAFLECCYIVWQNVLMEQDLDNLDEALAQFYWYREVFKTTSVITTFSLLHQHAMKHYRQLIQLFGALNGLCSSITESKHVKAVKKPYWCTNKYCALGQMLLINQCLDKLAASQGTCLSAALDHLVVTLADKLHILNLPELVQAFLIGQLYPDNSFDPTKISHLECPGYNGKISIYNSATSTFYALSDLSRIGGMCQEYIHAAPNRRQEGPHYDCVFVITDLELQGMCHMDIACILCFFSFRSEGIFYPSAIMQWFDCVGDAPDETTRMWMVWPSFIQNHQCNLAVIHVDSIFCAAHLIPIYGRDFVLQEIAPCHSYDAFNGYYVNKFADHHAFEVAY
ncbi:hypothetical protein EDC04DRAFT_2869953 [Pisolithus marmoratus]|nr:hypothetical protein EDC04DRAFT_2869953 [Pisolithus marmoratus]